MLTPTRPPGRVEFIFLNACLISMVAMCIDAVLPALGMISADFSVSNPNDRQWVIGVMFLGLTLGQFFYGPLADRYGRRRTLFGGIGLFLAGSLLCWSAQDFEALLLGRLLQGAGVAGPRIVSTAMIRDRFKGVEMAQVSSLIMTVFIAVPVLAPAIGQVVLWFGDWRDLFLGYILWGAAMVLWVGLRQPESLPNVRPLNPAAIAATAIEVLKNRPAMLYTLAVGSCFGGLVGFLLASQQIYQDYYQVGDAFALYFGASAFAVGIASFANNRLVQRFGMRAMVSTASLLGGVWTLTFAAINLWMPLSLAGFVIMLVPLFFAMGLCFGNLNALAMEPMGHLAGTASAIIGTLSSLVSVVAGSYVGNLYDGSIDVWSFGVGLMILLSWVVVQLAIRSEGLDTNLPAEQKNVS